MYFDPLELRWLTTQGGRDNYDVLIDPEGRKYVYMYTPRGPKRVYIPSVEFLREVKWNNETWGRKKYMS